MVHTHDIADGVQAKLTISDVLEHAKFKILYGMLALIGLTLVLSYGSVALVLELVARNNPDWNTNKRFDESFRLSNPGRYQQELVSQSIPFLQQWFRTKGQGQQECSTGDYYCDSGLLPNPWDRLTYATGSCMADLVTKLEDLVPETVPTKVELVLHHMGLRRSVPIRNHLSDYLMEPQPLQTLYNSTLGCWASVSGLTELACSLERSTNHWDFLGQPQNEAGTATTTTTTPQQDYVQYILHVAVVLEVLTTRLSHDPVAVQDVLGIFKHDQWPVFQTVFKTPNRNWTPITVPA